jgi:membrane associated rhomboid family serine protease
MLADNSLPPAPATRWMLLACVLVFALQVIMPAGYFLRFALFPGLVTGDVVTEVPVLPFGPIELSLLTSLFLHAGLFHLVMNMLMLWVVGRPVEWAIGPLKFLAVYIVCGVAGGLAQTLSEPASMTPVVGASGAISGLLAVYLLVFARPDSAGSDILGVPVTGLQRRVLALIGMWLFIQALTALVFNEGHMGGVAIWAHIGGFLPGLVVGYLLVRKSARWGAR